MNGLPYFGAYKKMLFCIGQFGRDELIPLIEVNGDDPTWPGIAVGFKGCLLDSPSFGHKGDELIFRKVFERENRGHLLLWVEIERLTMAFPRVMRPACGSSWTFIQWIFPASVKNKM